MLILSHYLLLVITVILVQNLFFLPSHLKLWKLIQTYEIKISVFFLNKSLYVYIKRLIISDSVCFPKSMYETAVLFYRKTWFF